MRRGKEQIIVGLLNTLIGFTFPIMMKMLLPEALQETSEISGFLLNLSNLLGKVCIIIGIFGIMNGVFSMIMYGGYESSTHDEPNMCLNPIRYYDGNTSCIKGIVIKNVFSEDIAKYITENIISPLNDVCYKYSLVKDNKDDGRKQDYEDLYMGNIAFFESLMEDFKKLADDYKNAENEYVKEEIEKAILSDTHIIQMVEYMKKESLKIEKRHQQYEKDIEEATKTLYQNYNYNAFNMVDKLSQHDKNRNIERLKEKYQ